MGAGRADRVMHVDDFPGAIGRCQFALQPRQLNGIFTDIVLIEKGDTDGKEPGRAMVETIIGFRSRFWRWRGRWRWYRFEASDRDGRTCLFLDTSRDCRWMGRWALPSGPACRCCRTLDPLVPEPVMDRQCLSRGQDQVRIGLPNLIEPHRIDPACPGRCPQSRQSSPYPV